MGKIGKKLKNGEKKARKMQKAVENPPITENEYRETLGEFDVWEDDGVRDLQGDNLTLAQSAQVERRARRRNRNRIEHLAYQHARREAKLVEKLRKRTPVPTSPEEFIAKAEAAMSRMIDQDNVTAVIFTLKTLGANKGWVENGTKEIVDESKINSLESFFKAVGSIKPAPPPPQEFSEPPCMPTESKLVRLKGPDSSLEHTSPRSTNFPEL